MVLKSGVICFYSWRNRFGLDTGSPFLRGLRTFATNTKPTEANVKAARGRRGKGGEVETQKTTGGAERGDNGLRSDGQSRLERRRRTTRKDGWQERQAIRVKLLKDGTRLPPALCCVPASSESPTLSLLPLGRRHDHLLPIPLIRRLFLRQEITSKSCTFKK
ncbi:hypothetical protein C4D60_Mb10t10130 [Musa balbisiana]|uniref:Uncharacterized protein n=1 Tax=Musa balbisiana TaxID=52838 RepID=A0A4S8IWU5_MUSBA|nr:hypothetical protein C4D60_Mb10t10130 [Musa balbisiana]